LLIAGDQGFASTLAEGSLALLAKRVSHGSGFGLAGSSTSAGFQPPRPCKSTLLAIALAPDGNG
jgi:hypothetical protein